MTKLTVRTGPKRRRWRRRDWTGVHGIGHERRDNNEFHFKRHRESKRSPKVNDVWDDTLTSQQQDWARPYSG